MLRRCLGFALAGLVFALSLPFLVSADWRAGWERVRAHRKKGRNKENDGGVRSLDAERLRTGDYGFEYSIKGYADVIHAAVRRQRCDTRQ